MKKWIKKPINIIAIALAVLLIMVNVFLNMETGNSPEKVAKDYLNAVAKWDYKNAYKYSTAQQYMSQQEYVLVMQPGETSPTAGNAKIMVSEPMYGDNTPDASEGATSASVDYVIYSGPVYDTKWGTLRLSNVNGKWYVEE